MEIKKSNIDIAVLILFFNRPLQLAKVFEQVKKARPSRLYLFQDGARDGREDDIVNIQKCREVVSDIDWECEVFTNYQERNNGCDPSEYLAQKWMFETEDMGIVLEDDDVPSQSFFPFCKELLEKYKDDQRISMICGMNNLGDFSQNCPYDYFFSSVGSIWGWASWKRVIDEWEESVPYVDDEYFIRLYNDVLGKGIAKEKLRTYIAHNKTGRAHYESISSANGYSQGRLKIIPTKNMISNIGFTGESTHGPSSIASLPRRIRSVFNMERYELNAPLKHPCYIMEDMLYKKRLNRLMANGHPLVRFYRKWESRLYRLLLGDKAMFKKMFKKK